MIPTYAVGVEAERCAGFAALGEEETKHGSSGYLVGKLQLDEGDLIGLLPNSPRSFATWCRLLSMEVTASSGTLAPVRPHRCV